MFNTRGYIHPFLDGRTYLYGVGELPRTLTELAICDLSATIRRCDSWWLKWNDSAFREHWLTEESKTSHSIRTSSGQIKIQLSDKQVKYVLDELQGYAALRDPVKRCHVACFDRIWETSSPLEPHVLDCLSREVSRVQTNATRPGTYGDIIGPYSYPVRLGLTLGVINGRTEPIPEPQTWHYAFSTRFAMLPTEFIVPPEIDSSSLVTNKGYINGIPPSMTNLYSIIHTIISRTIPLFEHVLTDLHRNNPLSHRIKGAFKYNQWDEPDEPEHSDDEDGWANYEREMREWVLHRSILHPDVPEDGYTIGSTQRRFNVSLEGRTLKIVTRVTKLTICPDHDVCASSPWHAEGMANERIVACALTCVSATNVQLPTVSFRMAVQTPLLEESLMGDIGAIARTWGLEHGSPSHQYLGHTTLKVGHIITYPNIYQTQTSAVRLADSTKEGSMMLLGFYLVDPDETMGVLTTTQVPPQNPTWVRKALEESLDVRIPIEIIDRIMSFVDWLMGQEEAEQVEREMRDEREAFWPIHDQHWFSVPFSAWSE